MLGFTEWGDVKSNPAAKIAEALNGDTLRFGGTDVDIVGQSMPVSYEAAINQTLSQVQTLQPVLLLGIGLRASASQAEVESKARRKFGGSADVRGQVGAPSSYVRGRRTVRSRINDKKLAKAINGRVSSDAGSFVCNAWLHQITERSDVLSGFVHVPKYGIDVRHMLEGIKALVADELDVDEDLVEVVRSPGGVHRKKRALIIYDEFSGKGETFWDSARLLERKLKAIGFAVQVEKAEELVTKNRLRNYRDIDLLWTISHGGWDGPAMFEPSSFTSGNTVGRQVSPWLNKRGYGKLIQTLQGMLNDNALFVVHACRSGGSSRHDNRKEEYQPYADREWVREVAEKAKIFTLGVNGKTSSANRHHAEELMEFALYGKPYYQQVLEVFDPKGRLWEPARSRGERTWPGWMQR